MTLTAPSARPRSARDTSRRLPSAVALAGINRGNGGIPELSMLQKRGGKPGCALCSLGAHHRFVAAQTLPGIRDAGTARARVRRSSDDGERHFVATLLDVVPRNAPLAVLVEHRGDGFDRQLLVPERAPVLDHDILAVGGAGQGGGVLRMP